MTLPTPRWRRLEVDGAPMELMEAGEGDPLLFLHGWGLTPRTYADAVLRLCAAGVRVIAPSLPGFGGSAALGLRAGLHDYALRIAALLDQLDPDRPVFVVGHSLGGGIALRLALDRPDLVRAVTVVNPVGGAPDRSGLRRASWLFWAAGALTELDPREWWPSRATGRLLGQVLRDFVPNLSRHPFQLASAGILALTADLADEVAELVDSGLPVLFVWGDQDRLIMPGRLARVTGPLGPDVVSGRHGWMINHPEEFAATLRDALVVHALLERVRRGEPRPAAVRIGPGQSLADVFPPERRRRARHVPTALKTSE
ncbi:MAG TPA: alpha/beta hydrolase [Frankiaceae bacterium]|nr:alpha/beta hydrolase [Frankiaceae bacterium]